MKSKDAPAYRFSMALVIAEAKTNENGKILPARRNKQASDRPTNKSNAAVAERRKWAAGSKDRIVQRPSFILFSARAMDVACRLQLAWYS